MFVTATLPVNFAYIMTRFSAQMTGDTASDWESVIQLRMSNHIAGQELGTTEHVDVLTQLFTPGSANPARTARWDANDGLRAFTAPMWSLHGGGIDFRMAMSNVAAAAGLAAFIITHCDFLEFDLVQAQRFPINTAFPVLAR